VTSPIASQTWILHLDVTDACPRSPKRTHLPQMVHGHADDRYTEDRRAAAGTSPALYAIRVPRNYSLPTIKTLFGQASRCAYPGCQEPLIFEDKGVSTVVAQIAHIRSEKTNGPRHDPSYTGDIDGDANLLLLCGKHHPPVDRHESIYPIEELLGWKRQQVSTAGLGTQISTEEAKRFTGLSQEERQAMAQVARLTSRVARACERARDNLNLIESERRRALDAMRGQMGPAYALNDDGTPLLKPDGTKVNVNETMQMSPIEAHNWRSRADASLQADMPGVREALDKLDEEVSVLRMINLQLGAAANRVVLAADGAAQAIGNQQVMEQFITIAHVSVHDMWLLANPDD
jgi:hypothetical protein